MPEINLKEIKEKQNISNEKKNNNFNYYSHNNINQNNNDHYGNDFSKKTSRHNIDELEEIDIKNSIEGIKFFVKRNNFNLFQLMSENAMEKNKDYITKNNLLSCLQKINIDITDEQLTRLLIKYDLFKDYNYIPINEFSKLLNIE